ncbi:MAG: cupredoxin domain-containing protein [Vulcanimicrobiaceae bacterium]
MLKLLASAAFGALLLSVLPLGLRAEPTAAPLLPAVLTVHIRNFAFHPSSATIHRGDRVTFVNDDSDAHTVTAADRSFDSGGLDTGDHWQHVFERSGTFAYFCALHPYMKATLVVAPIGANP